MIRPFDMETGRATAGYMADVSSVPLFSPEEEKSAFLRYETAEDAFISRAASLAHMSVPAIANVISSLEPDFPNLEEVKAAVDAVSSSGGAKKEAVALSKAVRTAGLSAPVRSSLSSAIKSAMEASEASGESTRWADPIMRLADDVDEAKNAIVEANLRLVISFVKRHGNRSGLTFYDLIQEGNMGLIRSVEKFDHRRGVRFATYASWWIRQGIRRALSDSSRTVRIPVHVLDKMFRLTKEDQVHATKTGRPMSDDEAMKKLSISKSKLEAIKGARMGPAMPLEGGDDESASLIGTLESPDPLPPPDKLALEQLGAELREVMALLTPQEFKIISWRYGLVGPEPLTLQQIADKYKLSRERIRQLEARALKKLRNKPGQLREHL